MSVLQDFRSKIEGQNLHCGISQTVPVLDKSKVNALLLSVASPICKIKMYKNNHGDVYKRSCCNSYDAIKLISIYTFNIIQTTSRNILTKHDQPAAFECSIKKHLLTSNKHQNETSKHRKGVITTQRDRLPRHRAYNNILLFHINART